MSPIPDPTRREAVLHTAAYPEPNNGDELSVVIAGRKRVGSGVAELWCGSALLGILHDEPPGGIVLRLESHARGPRTVSAVALERALADARKRLAVAIEAEPTAPATPHPQPRPLGRRSGAGLAP
jgi:hypothetical protein